MKSYSTWDKNTTLGTILQRGLLNNTGLFTLSMEGEGTLLHYRIVDIQRDTSQQT